MRNGANAIKARRRPRGRRGPRLSAARRDQVRSAVALLEAAETAQQPSENDGIHTEGGFRGLVLLARGGLLPWRGRE